MHYGRTRRWGRHYDDDDMVEDAETGDDEFAVIEVFDLQLLRERNGDAVLSDREFRRLWSHSAEFLLARSEQPPESLKDWRQDVKIVCRCDDCRELQAFALDPATQWHRFRVRKGRRQQLHQQIDRHRLDMTHVTERTGSPQTLVCSKTRATYEHQCRQYNEDLASMAVLPPLIGETDGDVQTLRARMEVARQRCAPA